MVSVGAWKNYEELEDSLCFAEAAALLTESRRQKREDLENLAAINGIDMSSDKDDTLSFDDIKARAEMKAQGVTDERQLEFAGLNMAVEVVDY